MIREADNWDISNRVLVYRTWRTSSEKLSDAVNDFLELDEHKLTVDFGIELVFNSSEERKKALRGNCARADVEIVYPRAMPGTGRLKVQVTNGNIQAVFDKVPSLPPPTFETLILKTTNGEIQLENVQIIGNTTLSAANGHVYGSLRTVGTVEASLLNGPIDLAISTGILPGVEKWNPKELDVKLETLNGPVTLEVVSIDLLMLHGGSAYFFHMFRAPPSTLLTGSLSLIFCSSRRSRDTLRSGQQLEVPASQLRTRSATRPAPGISKVDGSLRTAGSPPACFLGCVCTPSMATSRPRSGRPPGTIEAL